MTLFVDMDEVFADTYNAHLSRYNTEFNENLTELDCIGKEVWQCVPKVRQRSIHEHARTLWLLRRCNFQIPFEKKVIGWISTIHLSTGKIVFFAVVNTFCLVIS